MFVHASWKVCRRWPWLNHEGASNFVFLTSTKSSFVYSNFKTRQKSSKLAKSLCSLSHGTSTIWNSDCPLISHRLTIGVCEQTKTRNWRFAAVVGGPCWWTILSNVSLVLNRWLENQFEAADKNKSESLSFDEILRLLDSMNIHLEKGDALRLFNVWT